ncbi:unnamed protein product, partial [Rotaria sp. Silwood1]
EKLEEAILATQHIQTQLTELLEEKSKFEETSILLKQDIERLQTELEDRDRTQNMATNEREAHYQAQIKELETKKHQSLDEIQHLQSELIKLREDKNTIENQLNETIDSLKQDHERHCKELQTEIDELNEREEKTVHQHESEFEQQRKDYEDKLEEAILASQRT